MIEAPGRRGRRPSGAGLPLTAWAGGLTAASTLAAVTVTAGVLRAAGRLDRPVVQALCAGAFAGLLLSLVAAAAADRLGNALHELRSAAVRRLQNAPEPPSAPPARPIAARAARELAQLAELLEALYLRVRLSDEVGERHRVEAETVGAGVFALRSGLVAAEEGARGQLAAELHDTVAQSLALARGLLGAGRPSPVDLVRLGDHLEDAEEQVRAVMAHTRPPALREGDLATAVAALCQDMRARYGLAVRMHWPATPVPLPLASAVTLYRFFQEALLNVVKHADVEEAVLTLEVEPHTVRASLSDAGAGFDPAGVRPVGGRHVGLGLLRERARLSGGLLRVTSDGDGTTLLLELPRPSPPAALEAVQQRPTSPVQARLPAAPLAPVPAPVTR